MAIKMVYQLQADEENWTRWPDLIEHYQMVQAKSFSISLKGWKKILPGAACGFWYLQDIFEHWFLEVWRVLFKNWMGQFTF